MDKQIGFIGCGNMGMAIIGGMLNKKIVSSNKIMCSDLNTTNLENASTKYGITITTDNNEVAKNADILILSIKPDLYSLVINEIKEVIKTMLSSLRLLLVKVLKVLKMPLIKN